MSIIDNIRAGDRVTIVNRFGQKSIGRAVMKGPAGWVLNMGGRYGIPAIADERNTIKVVRASHQVYRSYQMVNGLTD